MDELSYLSVLISIILGLAITQVLTGVGRLLQARRRDHATGVVPQAARRVVHRDHHGLHQPPLRQFAVKSVKIAARDPQNHDAGMR